MSTCRTCRHWQASQTGKDGEPKPAPMLRHGFAACAQGECFNFLPSRRPACGKYQAISQAARRRREEVMAELEAKNLGYLKGKS
ncbi:MAG: hypothetical protein ACFNQI_01955 [Eikenella corrodens]|uniref:Uncharacterized protein n=1 Tax=Myoviridae sp. ctiv53 TaxID=2827703 RepID=A0A8S5TJ26_9CAUD|nr:MAG TPA: hypothetical protein [Myoviridae sp. ctiv53]